MVLPTKSYFLVVFNKKFYFFFIDYDGNYIVRVNPERNIFSINVELTSTFFPLLRFGPSPLPNFKHRYIYSKF